MTEKHMKDLCVAGVEIDHAMAVAKDDDEAILLITSSTTHWCNKDNLKALDIILQVAGLLREACEDG